jgi:putative DNA primase/helicase
MNFKDPPPGAMFNEDWFTEEEVAELRRKRLQPFTLGDFLSLKIPPREMLLAPVLPEKGLAMMYAVRGTGKTLVALGIAMRLPPAPHS